MALDPVKLSDQFFEIAERGDEGAAKQFLIDNLKEFPQKSQDAIITAFIEEALAKKSNDDTAIAELQKRGLATAEALEETKEELEKKLKLLEIKESL